MDGGKRERECVRNKKSEIALIGSLAK